MEGDGGWRTYTLTKRDMTKAQIRFTRIRLKRVWLWLCLIAFAMVGTGVVIDDDWRRSLMWDVWMVVSFPLAWRFIVIPRLAANQFRNQPALSKPMAYALRPDGFHARSIIGESRVNWSAFQDHWLGEDIVLLFSAKAYCFIIPADVVTPDDRAFLRSNLTS